MIFHIWLTIQTPFDEIKFITHLTSLGYGISTASENKEVIRKSNYDDTYGLLSCRAEKENLNKEELFDSIMNFINNEKIIFYSLIISELSYNALWNSGNATIISNNNLKTSSKKILN